MTVSKPGRPGTGAVVPAGDLRTDELTGDRTYVVDSRQDRPNLPPAGCPFCPGGLEAPDPYEVRWFANRWPALPDGRCEVVLYTPDHDATFWSLGPVGARRVIDLWAERSAALGARDDVRYVLPFENRGPEVGATIAHPHGQIYAFDFVPEMPLRELDRSGPVSEPGDRLVASVDGWRAWVPEAPTFPYVLLLMPDDGVPDLPSLDTAGRRAMAALLVDVLERLDRLFAAETPYMLWVHQRPFDGGAWPGARVHLDIVSPWRAPHVTRYIAAGELGSGVYFNPVAPEAAAQALREPALRAL
jgi:UDPglucose--hexose-1-phosphate uridylyltransferase